MTPLKKGYHTHSQIIKDGERYECKNRFVEGSLFFRRIERYRQTAMFSSFYELHEKQLIRIEVSWTGINLIEKALLVWSKNV